jgi:hypothetical protein
MRAPVRKVESFPVALAGAVKVSTIIYDFKAIGRALRKQPIDIRESPQSLSAGRSRANAARPASRLACASRVAPSDGADIDLASGIEKA